MDAMFRYLHASPNLIRRNQKPKHEASDTHRHLLEAQVRAMNAVDCIGWNRYVQERMIGSGGYGSVYLCRDTLKEGAPHVAVKSVALAVANEREAAQAMSEVAILRSLPMHPNVLRYLDCFIDPEQHLCLVTEYADGGDLSHLIKSSRHQKKFLDAFFVLDVIRQALEGLAFLHSNAILHRDIKPANLFIMSVDGTVKIGDFGVARLLNTAAGDDGGAAAASTFIGTPFYMCPELCMGLSYSYSADLWALGVTMYEVYLLKLPFFASNVLALANVVCEGTYDEASLRQRPKQVGGAAKATHQPAANAVGSESLTFRSSNFGFLIADIIRQVLIVEPTERPSASALLSKYFYGEESIRSLGRGASSCTTGNQEASLSPPPPPAELVSPEGVPLSIVETNEVLGFSSSSTDDDDTNDVMDEGLDAGRSHPSTEGGDNIPLPLQRLMAQEMVCRSISERYEEEMGDHDEVLSSSPDGCGGFVQGKAGWAVGTSIYRDPARLQALLHAKAVAFHRRRRAKWLAYLRDPNYNGNNAYSQWMSTNTAGGPLLTSTAGPSGVYVSGVSCFRPTGTSGFEVSRAMMRSARSVGGSSAAVTVQFREGFQPERVHFSDEDEDDSDETDEEDEDEENEEEAAEATPSSSEEEEDDTASTTKLKAAVKKVTAPMEIVLLCRCAPSTVAAATSVLLTPFIARAKRPPLARPSFPILEKAISLALSDRDVVTAISSGNQVLVETTLGDGLSRASHTVPHVATDSNMGVIGERHGVERRRACLTLAPDTLVYRDADGDGVSCGTARDWSCTVSDYLRSMKHGPITDAPPMVLECVVQWPLN